MTTLREAAQRALEALVSFESGTNGLYEGEFAKEIAALKAALAEPEDWELRRLRAELDRCKTTLNATAECWRLDVKHWTAQRDDMLEVLRLLLAYTVTLEKLVLKNDREKMQQVQHTIAKMIKGGNDEST